MTRWLGDEDEAVDIALEEVVQLGGSASGTGPGRLSKAHKRDVESRYAAIRREALTTVLGVEWLTAASLEVLVVCA